MKNVDMWNPTKKQLIALYILAAVGMLGIISMLKPVLLLLLIVGGGAYLGLRHKKNKANKVNEPYAVNHDEQSFGQQDYSEYPMDPYNRNMYGNPAPNPVYNYPVQNPGQMPDGYFYGDNGPSQ